MAPELNLPQWNSPRSNARPGFENVVLRLVKGGPERLAVEAGQIDAIIDPASGSAILLPEAQRALIEHKARFRSLVALSSDWHWQQDEHYRFAARAGAGVVSSGFDDAQFIGKALWELPFDNMSEADWQTHRNQLKWRATFHDLELRHVDPAGEVRYISLDGEPVFDEQEQFQGYRGTARDITGRKRTEALLQGSNLEARCALDSLAAQICVLDPAGTVILANKAWCASSAVNGSIGAGVREGASYLAVCDNAVGNERAEGHAIAAGFRQVMEGQGGRFSHEYACDTPSGLCWFVLTITGYRGDGAARAVVSRENITERKRAEQLLGLDYSVASRAPDANREPANRVSVANSLLAALPFAEYQRLLTDLEPVTLTFGEVLHAPGVPIQHVYFPINCLVSLLTMVDGRRALEVGLIGHEGMVGAPLALGIDVSHMHALVQGTGTAMRMEAAPFRKALLQSMPLQRVLYRYTHALMAQFTQTAACTHFHAVKARLARWLLMTHDRMGSDEFHLTHELLAEMLGIRRVGVTNAAGALQQQKLISYGRGHIRILDRKGLEAAACQCYQIVKHAHDRIQD
jgi:PAS domain S-box-containing protein